MFCPKCGEEVKDRAKFCPSCGAETGRRAPEGGNGRPAAPGAVSGAGQAAGKAVGSALKALPANIPRAQATAGGSAQATAGGSARAKGQAGAGAPPNRLAKLAIPAAAALIVVILIVCATRPRLKEAQAKELVGAWFEEQTEYASGQARYEACFRRAVTDLTSQLSGKLVSIMEGAGIDAGGFDAQGAAGGIGDMMASYYSNSAGQVSLVEAVTSRSGFKVGKVEKEDGAVSVQVTVTGVDIAEVNRLLLNDAVSVQGIAKIAAQFVFGGKGGFIGNIASAAGGDISFILDGFVEKARTAEVSEAFTGRVTFEYNRETKEWEISSADPGLLDAWYGIR